MEKTLKFNSQIATSRVQSERLLALGLKPETADMSLRYSNIGDNYEESVFPYSSILALKERMNKPILGKGWEELYGRDIPAWGLHRLIEMMPENVTTDDWLGVSFDDVSYYHGKGEGMIGWKYYKAGNLYDCIIECYEWLIKKGYFNKEYLEE